MSKLNELNRIFDRELDRILAKKEVLAKIQADLDKIKKPPLVSIGPGGIGHPYSKEIKP